MQKHDSGAPSSGRKPLARVLAALGMAVALGALGVVAASSIAGAASSASGTVSLHKTPVGSVLANSSGRTLYLFAKDRNDKSACTGSCAKFWPPLHAHGKPTAGTGINASLLGTTKRADGTLQVTYKKHPLYTYAGDKAAGQANGQAIDASGGKWYVLSAAGGTITKAVPAAAAATTASPSTTTTPATTAATTGAAGGYGY
jgi:predicted lipoprotein with Yx(FWY)xxD motif